MGASPMCAQHRCARVSCKVVRSDPRTEGSRTTTICTEEHELHMRQVQVGELAQLNEALQVHYGRYIDVAAIDRRINALPGEVSVPRVGIREVSRGHSS